MISIRNCIKMPLVNCVVVDRHESLSNRECMTGGRLCRGLFKGTPGENTSEMLTIFNRCVRSARVSLGQPAQRIFNRGAGGIAEPTLVARTGTDAMLTRATPASEPLRQAPRQRCPVLGSAVEFLEAPARTVHLGNTNFGEHFISASTDVVALVERQRGSHGSLGPAQRMWRRGQGWLREDLRRGQRVPAIHRSFHDGELEVTDM